MCWALNMFIQDDLEVSVAGCLGYDVLDSAVPNPDRLPWFQLLVV
jgi:hypothetical protein